MVQRSIYFFVFRFLLFDFFVGGFGGAFWYRVLLTTGGSYQGRIVWIDELESLVGSKGLVAIVGQGEDIDCTLGGNGGIVLGFLLFIHWEGGYCSCTKVTAVELSVA